MVEQFKHYSVSDFDRFDCVKLSKTIYLALAFLLRGYLVWMMSVTNFNDRVGVIQSIYPDPKLFYLNLASGSLGLLVVLLVSLRRPNASGWVKRAWPYTLNVIIVALIIDSLIIFAGFYWWQLTDLATMLIQLALALCVALLCLRSKRLKLNLAEFPEPLPEK
ncbi:DUF2919 family protein [Thalassotalea euphylliae]|uniref:DUF2919 family protein n=1 Tax=Thalassotalea euphylliae TaxID=1655234 RepID=A0A3E0TS22_9GAMM|nr:DUF2919 family protein [Thalassotalea euphylliae]REL26715.1 DUF2919 family protein [Thalassotalea euphylliae]